MNHPAGDRPRPDNTDFHHQIVEVPWLETRQHCHLRATLDLKNAHRVAFTDHVEDCGIS